MTIAYWLGGLLALARCSRTCCTRCWWAEKF